MDEIAAYAQRQAEIDALVARLKPLRRAQSKAAKKIKSYMRDQELSTLQAGEYTLTHEQKFRFSCSEAQIREEFETAEDFIQEHTKETWSFSTKKS